MILLTRRAQHTRLTGGTGTARADVGVSSDGSDSDSDSESDSELGSDMVPRCLAECDATLLAALDEVESFEQLCSVVAPLFASGCVDACRGTADEEEIRPVLEFCGLRTPTPTPCARRLPVAPSHT